MLFSIPFFLFVWRNVAEELGSKEHAVEACTWDLEEDHDQKSDLDIFYRRSHGELPLFFFICLGLAHVPAPFPALAHVCNCYARVDPHAAAAFFPLLCGNH